MTTPNAPAARLAPEPIPAAATPFHHLATLNGARTHKNSRFPATTRGP